MPRRSIAVLCLVPLFAQACGTTADLAALSLGSSVRTAAFHTLAAQAGEAPETSVLPDTGSASYAGYLLFDDGSVLDRVVADAELTVDFGSADVSGTFGDYAGPSGPLAGSGVISGAVADGRVLASFDGQILHGGVDHALSGSLDAGFRGPGAEFVSGSIEGTVTGGPAAGVVSGQLVLGR